MAAASHDGSFTTQRPARPSGASLALPPFNARVASMVGKPHCYSGVRGEGVGDNCCGMWTQWRGCVSAWSMGDGGEMASRGRDGSLAEQQQQLELEEPAGGRMQGFHGRAGFMPRAGALTAAAMLEASPVVFAGCRRVSVQRDWAAQRHVWRLCRCGPVTCLPDTVWTPDTRHQTPDTRHGDGTTKTTRGQGVLEQSRHGTGATQGQRLTAG